LAKTNLGYLNRSKNSSIGATPAAPSKYAHVVDTFERC